MLAPLPGMPGSPSAANLQVRIMQLKHAHTVLGLESPKPSVMPAPKLFELAAAAEAAAAMHVRAPAGPPAEASAGVIRPGCGIGKSLSVDATQQSVAQAAIKQHLAKQQAGGSKQA